MDDEVWKQLNSHYEISNYGRLKRISTGRILKFSISDRYPRYTMHIKNKSIYIIAHIEVARLFIGPRPDGLVINHKDANKLNNHVSNLEYVTQKQNIQHAARKGLLACAKLTPEEAIEIHRIYGEGKLLQREIAKQFNTGPDNVSGIVTGRYWLYLGLKSYPKYLFSRPGMKE